MDKQEFLFSLMDRLSGLPHDEIEERLTFYSEMIDDHMDEGLSEQEAVAAVGSAEEIASQIIGDIPITKILKEKTRINRRLGSGTVLLLLLGSPVWFSLLVAAAAVAFSLYVSLWSVIISFWAVFASFVGCAFGGLVSGVVFLCLGKTGVGFAMLSAALVLSGLSIFTFHGCKALTRGAGMLTKKIVVAFKNYLAGKGREV